MKGIPVIAVGASLASIAAAVPLCAINCFQDVVTEHPPTDCTEPDMYHCFCKMPDLQRYFVECAYSDCPSSSEGAEAIGFGVELCDGLGFPITIDTDPPTSPTPSPPESTDDNPPSETAEPTDTASETSEPTGTASETDPASPTETDSDDEPSGGSGPEPSTSPGGDDESDDNSGEGGEGGEGGEDGGDFVTGGAADVKALSVLLAFGGIAAAVLV